MKRDIVRRTLIAYDVPDDRRRTHLAKCLLRYGDRVQYSVFIVDCSPAKLVRLKDAIEKLIVSREDSVLFCDLGPVGGLTEQIFSFAGRSRSVTPHGPLVI